MKRQFKLGTLDSRMYIIFTLLLFTAIFIVQFVSFHFTIETVQKSTLENSEALLEQLVTQIDSYIAGMDQISRAVENNSQILQHFSTQSDPERTAQIRLQLQSYLQARTDVSNILIFDMNGTYISGNPDFELNPWSSHEQSQWFTDALAAEGETVVTNAYVQNLFLGRYSWVVSISNAIIPESGKEVVGVLLIDLKFDQIKELCHSMAVGRKGYNFILDGAGNYVFHPTQQLVYSEIRQEPLAEIREALNAGYTTCYYDGRHYTVSTSPLTGWQVVNVTYDSDMITDWRFVRLSYTILGFALFLIVGIVANRISSGITRPLHQLQDIMKSVDTGEFRLVGNIRATEEIRELAREYDIMVGRIRELMATNIREQELKRKSDLKALQAQINPHFLYNTLDSIIWMGEMKQHEKVVQMTSALAKLFRISISKGQEIIPISDEIAHVEAYLIIQEMRYRDKFSYHIDIDSCLYQYETLKITLQPLVENAIYHGIKEVDYKGRIDITGHLEDDEIVLRVKDNGRGMDEETKALLLAKSEEERLPPHLSRQGMGVRNVHERISLYFGDRYGLSCESSPGVGTTMTVRIPVISREVMS